MIISIFDLEIPGYSLWFEFKIAPRQRIQTRSSICHVIEASGHRVAESGILGSPFRLSIARIMYGRPWICSARVDSSFLGFCFQEAGDVMGMTYQLYTEMDSVR